LETLVQQQIQQQSASLQRICEMLQQQQQQQSGSVVTDGGDADRYTLQRTVTFDADTNESYT